MTRDEAIEKCVQFARSGSEPYLPWDVPVRMSLIRLLHDKRGRSLLREALGDRELGMAKRTLDMRVLLDDVDPSAAPPDDWWRVWVEHGDPE